MKTNVPKKTRAARSTGELIAEGKLAIGDGYRAKNSELSTSGLPFARAGNIDGGFRFENADRFPEADLWKVGEKVSQPGDVVFTSKGTVGRFAFVRSATPRFVYSPQLCFWRARDPETIDARWLYYWMLGGEFTHQMSGVKGQTDMADYVSLTDQRRMEITLPPPDEQRAIAGVLGALDDKIEQNRQTARALERLARAIFRAWFVDFEPVKAKAEGSTTFLSMPQPVFDALPTRFVDSAIGPVPEGWEVKAVSTAFDVNPTRRLRKNEPAPYLDMKNMPTEGHAPDSWIERPFGSGMRFMNGDTLVARITPCLENGKTAFVDFLNDGQIAWGSTEYIVLRPKPPLPPVFAYCLARTGEFRDFAIQNMTGTSGRQRVAPTTMDHFQLAVPDEEVAMGFGETVIPMFDCIRACKDESRKLAEIRDYLLPLLLSGKVRVKGTERALEITA
jgi:type I restriction enzyme, S subunit